ncbi:MAG TPA: iron-sulfur cluster assembly protein, partial [Methylomirabilota bacterium]|nr:iron-sulfur cluster assembly protein [Methylomirabilota bacterium]
MPTPLKDQVLALLRQMTPPGAERDIVSAGQVSEVFVNDGRVMFSITVAAEQAKAMEPFRTEVERRVKALPGVERAMVALTA